MKSTGIRRIIPLCACLLALVASCGDGPAGLNDFVPCEGPEPSSENAGFIHGTVIAAESDTPIGDAAVRLDGVEGCVSTDDDGLFSFPLAGGGGFKMTVTASGRTHARRFDSVIAGRDINVGQFALPKRDTAVSLIGPSGGTHRSAKGGLEITFPAGALREIREVSATRFEAGRELPGKLPETSHFTMALEAVAGDGDLDEPVVITIPNEYGFPPGTSVPVGVFDDESGEWIPDGTGVISEDGTQVVYEARHFSAFDCNYPVTSGGRPGLVGKDPRRKKDPCKRNSSSGNSIVDIRSGVLRLDVDMPVGRRGGIVRQTGLVYQSGAASPYAWTGGPWEDQAADPKTPEYAGVEVQVEGLMAKAYMDSSPEGNWAAYLWDGRNGRGDLMPTGLYDGWIRVYNAERGTFAQASMFGGQPTYSLGIEADEVVEADTTIVTRFQFINGAESPVGNGWYIKGLPELYRHPDGSVMIVIDGESGGVFRPDVSADIFAGGGDGNDCGEGAPKDNRCIEYPKDLVAAPDGSLITTDDFYNKIIRINTDGTISTVFSGEADGFDFKSVAVAQDGTVYFADSSSGKVFKLVDGQPVFVVGGDYPDIFGTTPSVSNPTDLDFDANGNLYIADWPLGLRIYNTDGILENAYIGDNPDYPAPVAIDVTDDGSVLLAEPVRQRVRRLTADGRIIPVAGLDGDGGFDGDGRPAAKARLNMPGGVVQGPDGTVYIADEYNDRIRTVAPDGIIRTFAGKGNISGSSNGDGGPATDTMIDVPSAPVMAADGNLLVLDHQNGVIWKFDLASHVFARPASEQGVLASDGESGGLVFSGSEGDWFFDGEGVLTSFTGADGVLATVGRNGDGRITSLQWADGDAVQFTWGANGLSGITAPGGRTMEVTVNGDRNVTTVTRTGVQTTFGYDGDGRLAGWIDGDGRTAEYTLDAWGRVTAVESADGAIRQYKPLETQGLINDIITAGNGLTADDPAPAMAMPWGEYTDAAGQTWKYRYDGLGEATSITMPDSTIVTLGNHTCGMPSIIDVPGTHDRRYFYDEWGRMLVDKGPEGDTEYTWDPYPGGLTGVSTPGWRMTNYEYDEDGRLVAIKAGSTLLYGFTYAEGARLAGMTDGLGRETVYDYDDRDNLAKVTQSGVEVATFERDDVGNITAITDAIGGRTAFGLDAAGLVATITDRDGATHAIGRDAQGQVKSLATTADDVTDGLSTVWGRDDRGRVKSATINGAGPWTVGMEGEDRVTSIGSPAGHVDATYDTKGRIVSRTISEAGAAGPSSTATFTYDADGHMVSAVDDDSSITWEYDQSTGALKSVTQQYAGMSEAITILYEMDGDGVVTAVEYPALSGFDGGRFEYGNDGATGLLTEIYTPDGIDFDLIRDEAGNITEYEVEWGESFELVRDYDARGYLQAVTAYDDYYRENTHMQFSYVTADDGAVTSVSGTDGGTVYSYDPMRRLTSAVNSIAGTDESFDYNGRGEPVGAGVEFDGHRRMTKAPGYTYTWDAGGRVESRVQDFDDGRLELTWDGDDNLIAAKTFPGGSITASHVVSYGYDALGRRVWREQDGVRQFFIYDFADIVLEVNQAGAADAFYLHEPASENPLAMYRGGEWYACVVDGLGSVRGLVRLSDRVLTRTWTYSAFGQVTETSGTVPFRYGFQAREADPVTGLIHFRARELDPVMGRFISTDPLKFTSFTNTYSFPGNDPVNRRDPTGAGPRAVTVAGEVYSTYNDGKQNLEKFADSTVSKVAGREAGSAAGYIWKTVGSNMIDSYAKIPLPSPYQSPGPNVTDAAVYLYKAYKAKDPCERAKVGGDVLVDMMPGGDKWLRPMVDNFNNFGNLVNTGN